TLMDLESADAGRRGAAVQWLAKQPVDEKRKAEVSEALNKSLETMDALRNNDLVSVMENWGTPKNVPALTTILEKSTFGWQGAMRVLGKLRDRESLKVIAKAMENQRHLGEARKTLKECGPAAEPYVIEVLNRAAEVKEGAKQPKQRLTRDE